MITTTLEQSLDFRPQERRVLPPRPYDEFVTLVTDAQESPAADVAVITFNYDAALDYAFHWSSVPLDYGLQDTDAPAPDGLVPLAPNGLPFARLHGSVNWVQCQKCGVVQPLSLGDFFTRYRYTWDLAAVDKTKPVRLTIEQALGKLEHCGQACAAEALIVPPTWNKSQYHDVIESVCGVERRRKCRGPRTSWSSATRCRRRTNFSSTSLPSAASANASSDASSCATRTLPLRVDSVNFWHRLRRRASSTSRACSPPASGPSGTGCGL